jgi:hypothetical protein
MDKVEEVPVELVIKILEVEGSSPTKYCVEFTRKTGNQMVFFEEFANIRDEIAYLSV